MQPFHWEATSFNATVSFLCALVLFYLLIAYRLQERNRQRRQVFTLYAASLLAWSILIVAAQSSQAQSSRLLLLQLSSVFWLQTGYLMLRLFHSMRGSIMHPGWTALSLLALAAGLTAFWNPWFFTGFERAWFGYRSTKGILYPIFIACFIIPPSYAAIRVLWLTQSDKPEAGTRYHTRSLLVATLITLVASLLYDLILPQLGFISSSNSFMLANVAIAYVYYRTSIQMELFSYNLEKAADQLFADMEEGMILTDLDGTIRQHNRQAALMLGTERLKDANLYSLLPDLSKGVLRHAVPITLGHGEARQHLLASSYTQKVRHNLIGYLVVLRDQDEECISTEGTPLASTQALRQAEQAVREQDNYLRTLIDNLPFEIWAKNTEGVYTLQNRLDIEKQGLKIGQPSRFDSSDPREVQQAKEEEKALAGEISRSEFTLLRSGKTLWYANTIMPIQNQGAILGILSITTDMTAQKATEQERLHFKEKLMHANKMEAMGSMAGGIAHDFNNLLGSLNGFCELALESLPPESSTAEYLRQALQSAEKAGHLVHQILSVTRDQQRQLKSVSLNFIVKETLSFMKSSIPPDVQVEQNLSENDITILADSSELHRVLLNLVTNSLHAMSKHGGKLSVRTRPVVIYDTPTPANANLDLPPGMFALIEVADSGHGIAPDKIHRIFDPFFTTKGPQEGSGLGLSIVHNILEANQAHIKVASEPDMGTCISVYWPLKSAHVPLLQAEAPASRVVLLARPALRAAIQEACRNLAADWLIPPGLNDLPRLWTIQRWRAAIIDHTLLGQSAPELAATWLSNGIQVPWCLAAMPDDTSAGNLYNAAQCRDFLEKILSSQEEN